MATRSASLSIAVAEDDDDFRSLLVTMLRWDGHTVHEFSDGAHLSDYLISAVSSGGEPMLVVADIIMPGMTGLAACQRARAAGCRCRFIFMSTFNDESVFIEALDLGPQGVFRKPFEVEALRSVVADVSQFLERRPV